MKKIIVEHGKMRLIGKAMGVTQPTVRKALRGTGMNPLLRDKIRRVAVREFGGVEVEQVKRVTV